MKVIKKRKARKPTLKNPWPQCKYTLTSQEELSTINFFSMGSPCEVIIDSADRKLAKRLAEIAVSEAERIEYKFSRYRKKSVIYDINTNNGHTVSVDEETSKLLDFSKLCFEISDGLFDITSGIFRKAWSFTEGARPPARREIEALIPLVGWQKVEWNPPELRLLPGMEIDFGGICKEYAVDRTALLFASETDTSCLINFGGDIFSTGPRKNGTPWSIGISSVHKEALQTMIQLKKSAIATSGDMFRCIKKDGKRYSHIINPETGWPVEDAPRSVTVLNHRCIDAGLLATLALLQGKEAESFLENQQIVYWCQR